MGSSSSSPAPVRRQREVRDGQKSFYLIMGKPPVTYTGNSTRPPLLYQVEVREAEAPEFVDKAETLRNAAYVTPKQKVRLIRTQEDVSARPGAVAALAPDTELQKSEEDGYSLNFMVNFDKDRCVSCDVDVFVNASLLYTKKGIVLMPSEPPGKDGDDGSQGKKPGTLRSGLSTFKKSLGGKGTNTKNGTTGPDGNDPANASVIAANRLLALDPSRQYHVFRHELFAPDGETLAPTQHFHSEPIMLDQLDAELSAAAPPVENNTDPTQSRAMALGLPASGNILIRLTYGLKVSRQEMEAKAKREREEKATEAGEPHEEDGVAATDVNGDDVGNWTGEGDSGGMGSEERKRVGSPTPSGSSLGSGLNVPRDNVLLSITHDDSGMQTANGDAGEGNGTNSKNPTDVDYIIQKQVSYSIWNFDKSARERHLHGSPASPASPERGEDASPTREGELMTEPLLCFLCAQMLEVHPPPLQPGEVRDPEQDEVGVYKIDDVFDIGGSDEVPAKSDKDGENGDGDPDGDEAPKPVDAVEVDEDDDTCVVCLTEAKDTVVLPCRHFCLCSGCAQLLRTQTNKCPICRTNIVRLMTRTAS